MSVVSGDFNGKMANSYLFTAFNSLNTISFRNPNSGPHPVSAEWPQYSADTDEYMLFGYDPVSSTQDTGLQDRLYWWNYVYPQIAQVPQYKFRSMSKYFQQNMRVIYLQIQGKGEGCKTHSNKALLTFVSLSLANRLFFLVHCLLRVYLLAGIRLLGGGSAY